MKTTIIAVVGSKKSGKTTTIEMLTRELTERGYKIATVKHIPEPNFTFDTEGKDTWRFAQAGASPVIAVSSNEIATIEKMKVQNFSLRLIRQRCKGNDIVFLEGFRKLVNNSREVSKIAIVNSEKEALDAVKNFQPIIAFAGRFSTKNLILDAPYADILKNPKKIADLVEELVKKNRS